MVTRLTLVAILGVACALGLASVRSVRTPHETEIMNRPIQVTGDDAADEYESGDGYVSSTACRSCHPSQYESWYGSFHRTMTQVATPDTVQADFDGIVIPDTHTHGRAIGLERRGDEFWAEFDDPGWEGPAASQPRITRQVVMITGSHHQQIYWYATGHDRGLNVLPAVYLLEDQRWTPRSAVVLHPQNQRLAMLNGHWNAICVACHTTAPKTQFDTPFRSQPFETQAIDTTAAEFGISCEACHGPGETHVQVNQNPLRRYTRYLRSPDVAADTLDNTIVQPARIDPVRSSQVCGQCHSVWEFSDAAGERRANVDGMPFRPGDELRSTRFVAQPMADLDAPDIQAFVRNDPDFVRGSFWGDGMIRVSGREYNGLVDSPCFRDATDAEHTLSCFSCHTLHKTADDPRSIDTWADTHQVSAGMESDAACIQCHTAVGANLTDHTNHSDMSSGSRCYNCHMPYTSYGLLKAVRSHTVSSPSVAESVEYQRPNACNLCHLDKTLGWTAESLATWYGTDSPALGPAEQTVAASLLWLLRGDAGLRALTAWSLGWTPAQETSGTTWMVPHLAELLTDPYDAVRYIAYRSILSLPDVERFDYDYVASREQRIQRVLPVLRAWQDSDDSRRRREPELLVDPNGRLRIDAMRRLFDQRDTRGLFLRE